MWCGAVRCGVVWCGVVWCGVFIKVLASEDCPLSFYDHDPALAVKLTKQVREVHPPLYMYVT